MPISLTCRSCGKPLKVVDTLAGRNGRCPGCGTINRIPATRDPTTVLPSSEGSGEQEVEEIPAAGSLAALGLTFETPPATPAEEGPASWSLATEPAITAIPPADLPIRVDGGGPAEDEVVTDDLATAELQLSAPSLVDEPPVAPPAARSRKRREPWYYGFLVAYAYVVIAAGVLQFAAVLALTIVALALAESRSQALLAPASLFPLGVSFLCLLGAPLIGAPILVAVDAARNLRAIRWR